jgi:hypothetical protein
MPTMKVVVCTPEEADVIQFSMTEDGFHIDLRDSADTVLWDATEANPGDPEMIFKKHVVLVGSRP